MTKSRYLEILMQGVDIWNEWRTKHQREVVDLSGVDLQDTNLACADLWGVNLSDANLQRANFFKADLTRTNLTKANMREVNLSESELSYASLYEADLYDANLSKVDLRYSDLRRANLVMANLTEVDLSFANLTGTDLNKADLKNAILAYTILGDTNLKQIRHIESCQHNLPSIIDQMTLIKSWPLPEKFLRGCGLPPKYVKQIPSLLASEEYYNCFISYSHRDKPFVRRLLAALEKKRISCWVDEKQLVPGASVREEVNLGIELADKVLLCCSKHSLSDSRWVDREINRALAKEDQLSRQRHKNAHVLVPIDLDGYMFSGEWKSGTAQDILDLYVADFTGWNKNKSKFSSEFQKLIRALRVK